MENNDVIKFLGNMKVVDLIALTKELETKWSLKAEPPVSLISPQTQQEVKVEQTEFSIVLLAVPSDKKVPAIKLLREITGLGLVECKGMLEKIPCVIKENVSKQEVDGIKMKFDELGLKSEMK